MLGEETSVFFVLTNRPVHTFPLISVSHMPTEASRADTGTKTPHSKRETIAPEANYVPRTASSSPTG